VARGDIVATMTEIASGETLDIKPSGGEKWTIHNIYTGGSATLIRVHDDGIDVYSIEIDSTDTAGGWVNYVFHVTETDYLQVRNDDTSAKPIGYDGVVVVSP